LSGNGQQFEFRNDQPVDPVLPVPVPGTIPARGAVVRIAGRYENGALVVTAAFPSATVGTKTAVPDSVVTVTLVPADGTRIGVTFFNDSTANLFLGLGTGTTTLLCTIKLIPGAYYEPPPTFDFKGAVTGVWDAAPGGACRVTQVF
jgi:hypothetical protein